MTATCTLAVISGPAAGSEVEVERELIIGRREADLTIPDEELSRRHAAVRPVEGGVVIEDLGSLNGTFVDGERISGPVTLTADATIRVGTSEVGLRLALAEPEPEPEPEDGWDDTGRTRLATAIPQEPVPIPQPQVTRVRQVPDAGLQEPGVAPPEPAPIPQPQVTRVREVPVEPQQPAAIPQAQATRVRSVAPGETVQADAPASPAGEAQAKRPSMLQRLLGRIRGRGKDGGEAAS